MRTLEEKAERLLGPLGIGRQNGSVQEKLANNLGMQNGMWYDNQKPSTPSDSGMGKGINEYPAISDMLGGKKASPQQRTVLQQAQADLDALYNSGAEVTQQDIDTILADACTQLLNDENRDALEMYERYDAGGNTWVIDSSIPQKKVASYTNAIDSLFAEAKQWGSPYYTANLTSKIRAIMTTVPTAAVLNDAVRAIDFIDKVRPKGAWDVKYDSSWLDSITKHDAAAEAPESSSFRFVYHGELINSQELGNILYGYAGTAAGYLPIELYGAGGLVQIYDDKSIKNSAFPNYFDTEADHRMIEKGISMYWDGK